MIIILIIILCLCNLCGIAIRHLGFIFIFCDCSLMPFRIFLVIDSYLMVLICIIGCFIRSDSLTLSICIGILCLFFYIDGATILLRLFISFFICGLFTSIPIVDGIKLYLTRFIMCFIGFMLNIIFIEIIIFLSDLDLAILLRHNLVIHILCDNFLTIRSRLIVDSLRDNVTNLIISGCTWNLLAIFYIIIFFISYFDLSSLINFTD